jgi:hypothetical protein
MNWGAFGAAEEKDKANRATDYNGVTEIIRW